ncbi:hypothetical protein HME7025_00100 [Aquirufa nivalisilvae]|uniref:Uncharacterized protein n=1 Tax=Aquirufa nivalisilvae TaxID=2516557 RepID=A0A2S2DRH4_9BACT|nr:hypothetical protein [Aquirufa nivalisilvae]AWL07985.1 hypothetical protein HME7025_00100 [Aquirufa nivalisilvae]
MKKVSLEENGKQKVYLIPENFSECTSDQISFILTSQLTIYTLDSLGDHDKSMIVKLEVLYLLSKIPKKLFARLTLDQQYIILKLVHWSFSARIETKPFEFFVYNKVKYYLPADNYADTSSFEWAICNIFYVNFSQNNLNTSLFYSLIATICRPERKDIKSFMQDPKLWNGDRREIYNSINSNQRAKYFEAIPMGTLLAVFQYWEAVNNRFVERNSELFESSDDAPMFPNGEGCLSLLEDVAEEGILGDLDKVHQANIHGLFVYLRHKRKKVEVMEKEMNKHTQQ